MCLRKERSRNCRDRIVVQSAITEGEFPMRKTLLALGAAAVALSAMPAEAKHYSNMTTCVKHRHGRCVAWKRLTRAQARHVRAYRVGYRFGPSYGYTAYSALPHPYVVRYHLRPDYSYVYSGNTIYVVDPATYAITRVINGIVR